MKKFTRRGLLLVATLLLAGCGEQTPDTGRQAVAPEAGTSCALDGMLLADFPGPKAQMRYAGQDAPDFFCDTVEMFHLYLNPEQVRKVEGLFVQDMGAADWDAPQGHWIDATQAYYVVGSSRHGSMGPTIASFAREADARHFAEEYGGKVYPFAGITADMAVLDGGALHDTHM